MKIKNLCICLLLMLIFCTGCLPNSGKHNNRSGIEVSGNFEIKEVRLGFKIPGRLLKRAVFEGEQVKKGEKIAWLESTEEEKQVSLRMAEQKAAKAAFDEVLAGYRQEEIQIAEARVIQAKAYLAKLHAGSRDQELRTAKAVLGRTRVELNYHQKEAKRNALLFKKEVISAQKNDAASTAFGVAKAREREALEKFKLLEEGSRKEDIEQARAQLKQAEQNFLLLKNGYRVEKIQQLKARLEQVQKGFELAQTRLGYTVLYAPISGMVLTESAEPGEMLAAGATVVTIGNLKKTWLRAYIQETDLGRIKLGQAVEITTDTYPDKKYQGKISFISEQSEFTPKNVQTRKERVKLVYRIKIDVPNETLELKPGMPADALIKIAESGSAK
ncbi:efflux RND transporter periplasmic adaptor subunit [Candidatus Riflebacteria bacterium]